jgi:arginine:pyruvate transaminase
MKLAPLVDRIASKGAAAWQIHFDARKKLEAGADVILLTVGDPDQAPPAAVIDATIDALKHKRTGYSPIVGYPEVRAAIAERFARRTGQPCTEENVVVVPGAQAGLYCALQCLVGPGDEVIVGEPLYANYEAVVGSAGGTMVTVPLRPESGFHLDLDAFARAITPKTKLVWINSPHNPTGAVMTPTEIETVAEACRRHDLWLLSDEVYEDLAFARPHMSPWSLPGMAERTIVVSSLSKSHAMPGYRFGWMIGPTVLAKPLFNLLLCMLYGGPPFVQDGALAALKADLPEAASLSADYRKRSALLADILTEAPQCRVIRPEGGMFVLLDVRETGLGSEGFAYGLLERENVAVLPCDGFGASAVGHLRISLTADEKRLTDAGQRIVRYARQIAHRNEPARASA